VTWYDAVTDANGVRMFSLPVAVDIHGEVPSADKAFDLAMGLRYESL